MPNDSPRFRCGACLALLPEAAFYRNGRRSTGVSSECKPCGRALAAARGRKHPERAAAASARYRATNPDKVAAWRRENKAAIAAQAAKWQRENAEVVRAHAAARRARLATPRWADRAAINAIYAEAVALTKATGVRHEVDHYYPLRGRTVSGLHTPDNLRVIPAAENRRKHNRLPDSQE